MTYPRTDSGLLILSLLLLLYMDTGAQGKEDDCVVQVRVARNTVVAAVENTTTSVRCPFEPCERKTEVSWCKIDNTAHCRRINTSDRIKIEPMKEGKDTYLNVSLLIFTRFTLEDPGLYRCELSTDGKNMSIVSHNINVSISHPNGHETTISPRTSTSNQPGNIPGLNTAYWGWLPFFYICLGVVVLVATVVLISFLSMRQCGGSKRLATKEQPHDQHTAPLASSRATPPPSLPSRPRSLRPTPARHSNGSAGVYDNHFDDRRASRNRRGASGGALPTRAGVPGQVAVSVDDHIEGTDSDLNVIVYAALNHKATRDSPIGSCALDLEEAQSEYAAIRIN